MDPQEGSGRRARLCLAAAIALVALAYAEAPGAGFAWDDHLLVGTPFPGWSQLLFEPLWRRAEVGLAMGAFYRPAVEASLAFDAALWGGAPGGYHVTNVLLHLGVCALVFGLARRGGASAPAAALAAIAFGAMPRLSESVAWVSGRSDGIAALGGLAALALHASAAASRAAWRRRVGAAACLGLGLLGKEVALAAGAALVAFEIARVRRGESDARGAGRALLPLAAVLSGWWALRALALAGAVTPPAPFGAERLLFALQALGRYARMLADPFHPSIRIGRLGVVEPVDVALGSVVAVAVLALAWRAWRLRWPPLRVASLALAGTALLPVLHWAAPFQEVVASDRYLYLPLAGLAIAAAPWLAAASQRLAGRSRPAALALAGSAAVLVVALVLGTASRVRDWSDEERLWRAAAASAHPLDAMPDTALGGLAAKAGDTEGAVDHYRRARATHRAYEKQVGVASGDAQLAGALALALTELGRFDEALATARQGAAEYPSVAVTHRDLALVHARRLEFDAADAAFAQALALAPTWQEVADLRARTSAAAEQWHALGPVTPPEPVATRTTRGQILATVGRLHDARALFQTIATDPEAGPNHLRLAALFLIQQGPHEAATQALTRLRQQAPTANLEPLEQALAARSSSWD